MFKLLYAPYNYYFSFLWLTYRPHKAIIKLPTGYRGVEQSVARQAHNLEVVGSSPSSATK